MNFYTFKCDQGEMIVWAYDEPTAREEAKAHLADMGQDPTLHLTLESEVESSRTSVVHSTVEDLT